MRDNTTFFYPKPLNSPKDVTVVNIDKMSDAEKVLICSLQGLIAKKSPTLYLLNNMKCYERYIDSMKNNYSLNLNYIQDIDTLLVQQFSQINGYILCDLSLHYSEIYGGDITDDSLNIATSLAGIKNAIIVDSSLEAKIQAMGFKKIYDVREKTLEWLLQQPEYLQLNKNLAFEMSHSATHIDKVRDYAIMCNAICFYDEDGAHTPNREKILSDLIPDSAIIGWGNAYKGEDTFINPTARMGHYYVAANYCYNMTFFSCFSTGQVVKQKNKKDDIIAENGNHYLTIVMSDGDNVQYAFGGFELNGLQYDSESRGLTNIGWGIPASLTELAPDILEEIYSRANDGKTNNKQGKDQFLTYSPGGYIYPSMYPTELIDDHIEKLADSMRRSDTNILGVIDFYQYTNASLPLWDKFTKHKQIEAVFYVDYTSYATDADTILWSNNKPIIASRARYWQDLPNSDITYLSNKINNLPTDISNPNCYSLLMVHCWSKSVQDVIELIKHFDSHVKIVTPETFVKLITENVDRTYQSKNNNAFLDKGKLHFVLNANGYCPEQIECMQNCEVQKQASVPYPITNAPAGNACTIRYIFNGESTFTATLLNECSQLKDSKIEFGILGSGISNSKVSFKFYNKENVCTILNDIDVSYSGWKYYSYNYESSDLSSYEICSTCSHSFPICIDEFVIRTKLGKEIFYKLESKADYNQLKVDEQVQINSKLTSAIFENISFSGAMFYKPVLSSYDSNSVKLTYKSSDASVLAVSNTGIVTAIGTGKATIYIEAIKDDIHQTNAVMFVVI